MVRALKNPLGSGRFFLFDFFVGDVFDNNDVMLEDVTGDIVQGDLNDISFFKG